MSRKKFKRLQVPDIIMADLTDHNISAIDRCKLAEKYCIEYDYPREEFLAVTGIPNTTYYRCLKILASKRNDLIERVSNGYISMCAGVKEINVPIKDIAYESAKIQLYVQDGICHLAWKRSKCILLFNSECADLLTGLFKEGFTASRRGLRHSDGRRFSYEVIALANIYNFQLNDTLRFGNIQNTNAHKNDYQGDKLNCTGLIAKWWVSRTQKDIYLFLRCDFEIRVFVTNYSKRLWDLIQMCNWRLTSNKYPAYYSEGRNIYFHSLIYFESWMPRELSARDVLKIASRSERGRERNTAHMDQNEGNNHIDNLSDMPARYHIAFDNLVKKETRNLH